MNSDAPSTGGFPQPSSPGITSASGSFSFESLRRDVRGLRGAVAAGDEVALATTDAGLVAAAIATLDGWADTVHLIGPGAELAVPEIARIRIESLVATDGEPVADDYSGERSTAWVVYSSGTTGEPTPVSHTLSTLSRTVVATAHARRLRWGILYDPTRMAGLQVILQAMASDAPLVAPDFGLRLDQRIGTLIDHGVTALSATPTLWRQVLQLPTPPWPLEQITLGGEIADQMVLDALANRFPDARIVHVFASTETGAAFSVHDGRAGFPVAYLDDAPRGIRLEVRGDILHVLSPGVSVAGDDGFVSTGDVVSIDGDRVSFRGRASGVVNVGGTNVWPEEVETFLRSHPLVSEALVWAVPNALAGNLLTAQVVAAPTDDPELTQGLGKELRKWARQHLANTHVPARVLVVDQLDLSSTGKVTRS